MENVLFITRNFPPLTGGMERLALHTYLALSNKYTVTLIGPNGCSTFVKSKDHAINGPKNVFYFLMYAFIKGWRETRNKQYKVCIGGSGVVAPIVVTLANIIKIPSLVFIHGLDLVINNRIYQTLFIPFIRKSTKLAANSRNTAQLAISKGVPPAKIEIIFPGVEIPDKQTTQPTFRHQYKLNNKKILLSVGRLIPRKGIVEFITSSFTQIAKEVPESVLVIIGEEAHQSLKKNTPLKKSILRIINQYKLQQQVILIGNVTDEILNNAYEEAELFIFPVIDLPGDVEGFGMVALEAASFGLPTLAFNAGGVSDAINNYQTGFLIEPNDYNQMTKTAINYLNLEHKNEMANSCSKFAQSMSWQYFGNKLAKIMSDLSSQ